MNYISTHWYIRFFSWQWVKTKRHRFFRVPNSSVSLAVLNAGRAGCFFPKISFYRGWWDDPPVNHQWCTQDGVFSSHSQGMWLIWLTWLSWLSFRAQHGKPEGFWHLSPPPLELWMTWLFGWTQTMQPQNKFAFCSRFGRRFQTVEMFFYVAGQGKSRWSFDRPVDRMSSTYRFPSNLTVFFRAWEVSSSMFGSKFPVYISCLGSYIRQ